MGRGKRLEVRRKMDEVRMRYGASYSPKPKPQKPPVKPVEAAGGSECPTCNSPTIGGRSTEWWLSKLRKVDPKEIELVAIMLEKFSSIGEATTEQASTDGEISDYGGSGMLTRYGVPTP